MSISSTEKRTTPRYVTQLPAHCRIGGRFVREQVENVSATGLFLRTRNPVAEGTTVRLVVPLLMGDTAKFCTLIGRVSRYQDGPSSSGIGLTLTTKNMSTADRATYEQFLSLQCK